MKIDDVDFSDEFVKGFASEEDFLAEMAGQGYLHIFQGPKRQDKLKDAYALHNPKKPAKPEAEKK